MVSVASNIGQEMVRGLVFCEEEPHCAIILITISPPCN
jgi:hypothetical protein